MEVYHFALSLYALLGLKDRVRRAAPTAREPLEELLELPSAEPRWEHQWSLLRGELQVS